MMSKDVNKTPNEEINAASQTVMYSTEMIKTALWEFLNEKNFEQYVSNSDNLYNDFIAGEMRAYKNDSDILKNSILQANTVLDDYKNPEKLKGLEPKMAGTIYNRAATIVDRQSVMLDELNERYKRIIKDFVDKELKIANDYFVIVQKSKDELGASEDTWIEKTAVNILEAGFGANYERKQKVKILKNKYVAQRRDELKKEGKEIETALNYTFSDLKDKEKHNSIKKVLEKMDVDGIEKYAESKIDTAKGNLESKFKKEMDDYAAAVKNIEPYFDPSIRMHLDDEVARVSLELGAAKLSGNEDAAKKIQERAPYKKIRTAAIAKELSDIKDLDFVYETLRKELNLAENDGIYYKGKDPEDEKKDKFFDVDSARFSFEHAYKLISGELEFFKDANGVNAAKLTAKARRKYTKELSDMLDTVESRVDDWLPGFLKKNYFVLSGSDYDETKLTTKKSPYFWLNGAGMLDKSPLKYEDKDHVYIPLSTLEDWYTLKKHGTKVVGPGALRKMNIYSQKAVKAAIDHTPKFLKDGAKKIGNYMPGFVKKMGGFVKKKLPIVPEDKVKKYLATKKVPIWKTKVDTHKTIRQMVQNHKDSSWGKIHAITEDMIVKVAGGLSSEMYLDQISSAWAGIEALDGTSDIQDIINAYTTASDLTEKINKGIARKTEVSSKNGLEFAWMDNYVNKKAGILYYGADKISELSRSLFNRQKMPETMKIEKPEEIAKRYNFSVGWDINDGETAIKPPTMAPAIAIAGGLGILTALGITAHNAIVPDKEKIGEGQGKKKSWALDILDLVGALGLDVAALGVYHGLTGSKAHSA